MFLIVFDTFFPNHEQGIKWQTTLKIIQSGFQKNEMSPVGEKKCEFYEVKCKQFP